MARDGSFERPSITLPSLHWHLLRALSGALTPYFISEDRKAIKRASGGRHKSLRLLEVLTLYELKSSYTLTRISRITSGQYHIWMTCIQAVYAVPPTGQIKTLSIHTQPKDGIITTNSHAPLLPRTESALAVVRRPEQPEPAPLGNLHTRSVPPFLSQKLSLQFRL